VAVNLAEDDLGGVDGHRRREFEVDGARPEQATVGGVVIDYWMPTLSPGTTAFDGGLESG
jgi:hypothetical protein